MSVISLLALALLGCIAPMASAMHPLGGATSEDCRRMAATWVDVMDMNGFKDWTCGEVSRRILSMNMNQRMLSNVQNPLVACNANQANSPAHALFGAVPCRKCPVVANDHSCVQQPGNGWYIMFIDTKRESNVAAHFINVFIQGNSVSLVQGCADNFPQRVDEMSLNEFMTGYRGLVASTSAAQPITEIMCYGEEDFPIIAEINLVGPLPTNHCPTTLVEINARIITDFLDRQVGMTSCTPNPNGKWKRFKKAVKEHFGNYRCVAPGYKFP